MIRFRQSVISSVSFLAALVALQPSAMAQAAAAPASSPAVVKETVSAASAAEYGLRPGQKVVFSDVVFKIGSSTLDDKGFEPLDKLGAYLAARPELAIEISGHADGKGNPKTNQTLSQKRAEAVKSYLVKKYKLKSAQLVPRGYGSTKAIAANDTDENRAKNRRIEVVAISADTGEVIASDTGDTKARAELTAVQGGVTEKAPWDAESVQAHVKDPIFQHHHVDVADPGRAEVTFAPSNRIQLFSKTKSIIDSGPRATRPKLAKSEATLESGELLTKLDALQPGEQFVVATPLCNVQTGARTKVAATPEQTVVSAQRGEAAVVVNGKTTKVPEGKGVVVKAGKVEGPFDLPAKPELKTPASDASVERNAETNFSWLAAPTSRFELTADAEGNQVEGSTLIPMAPPAGGAASSVQRLSEGTHYWTAFSRDERGLENSTETRSVRAVAPVVKPVVAAAPAAAPAPTVQTGSLTAAASKPSDSGIVTIEGKVSPADAAVMVNDHHVQNQPDGSFTHELEVQEGANEVTVAATKPGYAIAESKLSVTFEKAKPSNMWVGLGAEALIATNYRVLQMAGLAGKLRLTKLFGDHFGITGSMRLGVIATHKGIGGPHAVVGADIGAVYEFVAEGRVIPFAELTIGAFGYGPADNYPGSVYGREQIALAPRAGLGVRFGKHGFAPALSGGYRVLIDQFNTTDKARVHGMIDINLAIELNVP